jgi:hypothetical protein
MIQAITGTKQLIHFSHGDVFLGNREDRVLLLPESFSHEESPKLESIPYPLGDQLERDT